MRVEQRMKARQHGNSMIAKVIEMLGSEVDKIKVALEEEGKTMEEYTGWCDDESTEKVYAIKTASTKIEDLTATIEDNSAQVKSLEEEIHELGTEIAERTAEIDEATEVREREKAEFLKSEAEQAATVDELERMEAALKQQMGGAIMLQGDASSAPQGGSQESFDAFFLQVKSTAAAGSGSLEEISTIRKALSKMVSAIWVDPESKKSLGPASDKSTALIQSEDGDASSTDAEQPAPENNDNLAAFEGLKGKAEESLQKQRDEENKKQSEYNIKLAQLKQAIALAADNLDDAKKEKAGLSEDIAKAKGELTEATASKEADAKALKTVQHECQEAAIAWEQRMKEAKAEISAIEKAKGILKDRVTVFLQVKVTDKTMGGNGGGVKKMRDSLVKHFRGLGERLHSLAMLNLVSVATSDPMEQVKGLLTDLITKLEKEAAEAASLHQFCQEEKNSTQKAKEQKQMVLDKLGARLEKATATSDELKETVAELSGEISAIDTSQAEATKIRNEEHEEYMKIDTEFREGADAVDDAIDALKEFYGDASLLQTSSETQVVSADEAASSGKDQDANTIIGILDTIGDEFRKTVKDNEASERESLKAYETMVTDNKVAKASKTAEIKALESQIKMMASNIHDTSADEKLAQEEMAAILEYIEKLKPQCEGRTVPYAERQAKREAEIGGLKEGLAIIEADSPAGAVSFLQTRLHKQLH